MSFNCNFQILIFVEMIFRRGRLKKSDNNKSMIIHYYYFLKSHIISFTISALVLICCIGCVNRTAQETVIQNPDAWSFSLGDPLLVEDKAKVPIYTWFPDGHISVLPDLNGSWMMFWAGSSDYRTFGPTPYSEDQAFLAPAGPIFGGTSDGDSWHNGGLWLYSVFRLSKSNLIGFIHAEDHWYPHTEINIAWKSIAVTYSSDNGASWGEARQIITSWQRKPETPAWGGAGDFCIIRDAANSQWVCYYQEAAGPSNLKASISLAVSKESNAAPGTWYKWDGAGFSAAGLEGRGKRLPAFIEYEGGNPSVHWNTYLNKWVMVYGGWDNKAYISASPNLINWDRPGILVTPSAGSLKAWYPTIISDNGDLTAGKTAKLYYADIKNNGVNRSFISRTIEFSYEKKR